MSSKLIMGEQYILPTSFAGAPGGGTHVRVVAMYAGSPGCVPEALYDPTRGYNYWDRDVYIILPHEAEGCIPLAPVTPRGADAPDVNVPATSASSFATEAPLSEYDVGRLWDAYIELRKAGRPALIGALIEAFRELRGY